MCRRPAKRDVLYRIAGSGGFRQIVANGGGDLMGLYGVIFQVHLVPILSVDRPAQSPAEEVQGCVVIDTKYVLGRRERPSEPSVDGLGELRPHHLGQTKSAASGTAVWMVLQDFAEVPEKPLVSPQWLLIEQASQSAQALSAGGKRQVFLGGGAVSLGLNATEESGESFIEAL